MGGVRNSSYYNLNTATFLLCLFFVFFVLLVGFEMNSLVIRNGEVVTIDEASALDECREHSKPSDPSDSSELHEPNNIVWLNNEDICKLS